MRIQLGRADDSRTSVVTHLILLCASNLCLSREFSSSVVTPYFVMCIQHITHNLLRNKLFLIILILKRYREAVSNVKRCIFLQLFGSFLAYGI